MKMKAQVNHVILGCLKDQNQQESRTEGVVGHLNIPPPKAGEA